MLPARGRILPPPIVQTFGTRHMPSKAPKCDVLRLMRPVARRFSPPTEPALCTQPPISHVLPVRRAISPRHRRCRCRRYCQAAINAARQSRQRVAPSPQRRVTPLLLSVSVFLCQYKPPLCRRRQPATLRARRDAPARCRRQIFHFTIISAKD